MDKSGLQGLVCKLSISSLVKDIIASIVGDKLDHREDGRTPPFTRQCVEPCTTYVTMCNLIQCYSVISLFLSSCLSDNLKCTAANLNSSTKIHLNSRWGCSLSLYVWLPAEQRSAFPAASPRDRIFSRPSTSVCQSFETAMCLQSDRWTLRRSFKRRLPFPRLVFRTRNKMYFMALFPHKPQQHLPKQWRAWQQRSY